MSLINCPECNRQVSDQANSCPNCGFQIANYFNQKERELKQIEQQEKLNKKIAEQEKRKQLWINRFKEHKKKYILISSIGLAFVIALIVGSMLLYNRLQIKTFDSESEMKSSVEGVYIEEINDLSNYRITIEDDYITMENFGTMKNYPKYGENYSFNHKEKTYHIYEYDFKNGKIITDKETIYYNEKDENANDLTSYNTKSRTIDTQNEFIVKKENVITDKNHTYKK